MRINGKIRAPKIRLISSDGKQVGIVSVDEGVRKAQEEGLDLVEISPTANPPVCRVLDFGKYLYMLEKQEKEARKKQHVISIKEIKMTANIDDHDYQTKLRSALNFLERGDKVKLTLMFRGREATRPELGQRVIDRFTQDISDTGELERNEGFERRSIVLLYMPKVQSRKAPKTHSAPPKKKTEKLVDAETQNKQSGSEAV
ncbi:MAG: translation initiation factor IF-3 [Candidatus Omnitrophica bacterium]|nr:translation initiation factor IF-3 [Candidatus Omnitrophota bacterium]